MGLEITLGDKLEVLIGEKRCASMVQGLRRSGSLLLSPPTYRTVKIPLHPGEKIQVILYRELGMYSFIAQVNKRLIEGELEMLDVSVVSPVSKYQRRDFVRFETALTLHITRLSGAGEPLVGKTIDISGGGLRFRSDIYFQKDSSFRVTLFLGQGVEFSAPAAAIRCDEDRAGELRFITCAEFEDLTEAKRKQIIKYIFDSQLRRRMSER
jgi:c-di-GMP-binding flagellar brake protein YcgR